MILEVAILNVRAGQEAAFEAAFAQARRIIAAAPGCLSHELHRCQEIAGRYVLLVRWDSVASHMEGFRKSAAYPEWKRLLHHFYDPFPTVHHYDKVAMRSVGAIDIRAVDPGCHDAQRLIAELDAELLRRYPTEPTYGIDVDAFRRADGEMFIAYLDGEAVGCGGYRPISADTIEIKRMWVPAAHRGRGISKRLLETIESAARRRGFARVILETATRQPEAIGLYANNGYTTIAKYGEFVDDPWSVCFGKTLA